MDIPLAIFGVVMIIIGLFLIKSSINSYKNKEKDIFGSIIRSLIGGIGLLMISIIVIVKAFSV